MFKFFINKNRCMKPNRAVLFGNAKVSSMRTSSPFFRNFAVDSIKPKVLNDTIHMQKLNINTVVGTNLWNIKTKQKLQVSLHYKTDFMKSSDQDDLSDTLSYAVLAKEISAFLESNSYDDVFHLNKDLVSYLKKNFSDADNKINLTLDITLLESHLRSNSITLSYDTEKGTTLIIKNLKIWAYLGVFTFERLQKQAIDLELHLSLNKNNDGIEKLDISKLVYGVVDFLENSNFKTVETLVHDTSNLILSDDKNTAIFETEVKVIKPQAILQCEDGVGVSCVRKRDDFGSALALNTKSTADDSGFNLPIPTTQLPPPGSTYKVYLSVGTNQGNKLANIYTAIKSLESIPEVTQINKVSSIYKSKPMYYLDQDQFYNLALSLETTLPPVGLLAKLKEIEYNILKRVKHFDNGPRPIDLDIIYYLHGDKHVLVNDSNLVVPHKLMLERGFVLLPLTEILDANDCVHPVSFEPIQNQLNQIIKEDALGLERVTPLDGCREITWEAGNTNVMSIVNVTTDSFSDGSLDVNDFVEKLKGLEKLNGTIIDIGGCSTNPKSEVQVDEKGEIERIAKVIDLVDREKFIVSLDSYRINVIKHFIDKIDIINDIGFDFYEKADELSNLLVENRGKCYVLNHVPGNTVQELKSIEQNKDTPDADIGATVARDLLQKFNLLLSKGVNSSQIILDPGLGFGKKTEENFALVKSFKSEWNNLSEQNKDIPVLFGYSRKRFLNSEQQNLTPVERDLEGSILLTEIAKQNNVMVRTHNLDFTIRTLDMLKKLK